MAPTPKTADREGFEAQVSLAQALRAQKPRGRYAPSPSGALHLGNVRTALLAWLQIRLAGGTFVMRIEDLDLPRVRPGSAAQILEDLHWLGLDWDEGPDTGGPLGPYEQSARTGFYRHALELLIRKNLVFPCFCSRKDILQAGSAPHDSSGMALYPGTCRNLKPDSDAFKQAVAMGRGAAWRFRGSARAVHFVDQLAGPQTQNLEQEVGDFVVCRSDGLFAYQLAVVVDDGLMGMTDVLRGGDLLDSSARQIALFEALELPVPEFWHVPLMGDAAGRKLSKRDGSNSIAAIRKQGRSADAIIGDLASSLDLVPPGTAIHPRQLLARMETAGFREKMNHSPR